MNQCLSMSSLLRYFCAIHGVVQCTVLCIHVKSGKILSRCKRKKPVVYFQHLLSFTARLEIFNKSHLMRFGIWPKHRIHNCERLMAPLTIITSGQHTLKKNSRLQVLATNCKFCLKGQCHKILLMKKYVSIAKILRYNTQ